MSAGAAQRRTRWRSLLRAGLGLAVCLTLMGGTVSATAGEAGDKASAGGDVLGGFAVGDGLEAFLDERDGGVSFTLGLGGVDLTWDVRRMGAEPEGLGPGWSFGVMTIATSGGVRVFPASGGSYEADASQASGLHGYGMRDLVFRAAPAGAAPLEGRADGQRSATPYAYTVEQLGGVTTYFDADGRGIARVGATGLRRDWVWEAGAAGAADTAGAAGSPRLVGVIDERGVTTELDWRNAGELTVRPGANLPGAAPEYAVELGDDGVRSVTDPLGGVVEVTTADGLVSELSSPSGAVTRVTWSRGGDGAAHASRVSVADASGRELSHRTWRPAGGGAATGWPLLTEPGGGAVGYSTDVSDGSTKIRSTYTAQHLLHERTVLAADASGARELYAQTLVYPAPGEGRDAGADPAALPPNWARPVRATITHHDPSGASRSTSTEYAYDEFGRVTGSTDGTLDERVEYDAFGRVAASTLTEASASPGVAPLRTTNRYDGFGAGVEKIRSDGDRDRSGGSREVDAWGLVRSETDQRGDVTTYEHTVDGLLERSLTPSGQETRFEYDAVTRRLTTSIVTSPIGPAVTTAYRYDDTTGRLVAVTDPTAAGAGRDISYAYDAFGNTTEIAFGDGRSIRHRYDEHGRRVRAADGTEYVYDAANRRVSRTSGGHATRTTYWADGARRTQADGDSETTFYPDGATLLTEEHTGDGMASYLVGAGRHARTVLEAGTEPVSRAYDSDRHGSVVALIDDEGRVLERASYSDYGVPGVAPARDTSALWRNPFGYAGEYTERDGTQPLGDRVYDPHQLRFQTKDVAARHNLYAFGALNPITNVDPTGRTELSDRAISWIGTGLGAAATIASIGFAIATAGWSLTMMGVIGMAAEVAALGITAAQVADEFIPTVLEGDLERDLNFAAMGLGFGSAVTGAFASLDALGWAENLMVAERNLGNAITWTKQRFPLYDDAAATVERYRAKYLAATNAGQVRSKEIESMSLHEASDLKSAMSEVLTGLKHPDNGLALIHDGVNRTVLKGARQPFKEALSRGVLFAPFRARRVLTSTEPLVAAVKARGPQLDLTADIQDLGVAASLTEREAAARLAVIWGEVPSSPPTPRLIIDDANHIDGSRYPDAGSGSTSSSEEVVSLLG
jgi:RHS repeat-associated protein